MQYVLWLCLGAWVGIIALALALALALTLAIGSKRQVAVVLSQLYAAGAERREKETRQDRTGREALATHAELNALYMRVTGMLERKGLDVSESRGGGDVGNHGRRVRAPGHLKSVLLKGRLTKAECRSLFGLVKELEAAM